MATLKALKTRIGSVASSEKITGAMKMISSAKVHKNEQALRQLLPYKNQIRSVMAHLVDAECDFTSPLMETRAEVRSVGIVVYGSDDGLCGAYNINIFKGLIREVARLRDAYGPDVRVVVYTVGRKIGRAAMRLCMDGVEVVQQEGIDSKMDGKRVNDFTLALQADFLAGRLDWVEVVYMKFYSISRQRLTTEQLFPVDGQALADAGASADKKTANELYIFEPDANRIFNEVLPMFVLSTMQEITIENRASEQAARVMAMQSANDNAQKLLEGLQLEYNKLRQQSITTELLDILGGQVER